MKKDGKSLEELERDWKGFGLPKALVDELREAHKSGVRFVEPPEELVERTVKSCQKTFEEMGGRQTKKIGFIKRILAYISKRLRN